MHLICNDTVVPHADSLSILADSGASVCWLSSVLKSVVTFVFPESHPLGPRTGVLVGVRTSKRHWASTEVPFRPFRLFRHATGAEALYAASASVHQVAGTLEAFLPAN